jgi:hypothetical protein
MHTGEMVDQSHVYEWLDTYSMAKMARSTAEKQVFLGLNNFSGHFVDGVKQELHENQPRWSHINSTTSDVPINKSFKDHKWGMYSNWMAGKNHEHTPSGKVKRPLLEMMCSYIMIS